MSLVFGVLNNVSLLLLALLFGTSVSFQARKRLPLTGVSLFSTSSRTCVSYHLYFWYTCIRHTVVPYVQTMPLCTIRVSITTGIILLMGVVYGVLNERKHWNRVKHTRWSPELCLLLNTLWTHLLAWHTGPTRFDSSLYSVAEPSRSLTLDTSNFATGRRLQYLCVDDHT